MCAIWKSNQYVRLCKCTFPDAAYSSCVLYSPQFLSALHVLYVDTVSNPFCSIGSSIRFVCRQFC
jgi:hypothetical protein